jgi:hypothetical protein
LKLESYCFDERNRFRQISESVPGIGALFSFFKKFPMVLPLLTSGQGVSQAAVRRMDTSVLGWLNFNGLPWTAKGNIFFK